MKSLLRAALLLLVGVVIGFALGRYTGEKATNTSLKAVAVDCYDASGKLVPDQFAKFGGVTTSCAPGQTARLHQSSAPPVPAQDK
jgi:hypothetical protein